MKKAVLYFVLLLVIFRPGIIAQDFLDTVSYIPVVVTSWQNIDTNYRNGIPLINAMGADAMVIANQNWDSLDQFTPMKLLHYRHQNSAVPTDFVKYTDASYVVYEAEGTDTAHGRASLEVNSAIGFVPSGAYYAQTADTTRGYLILGPGVLQRMRYQDYFENQVQIDYQTDYILRLQNDSGYTIPDSLKICDLEITVRQKDNFYVIKSVTKDSITYGMFRNKGLNTWQPWSLEYRLDSLQFKINPHLAPPIEETASDVKWSAAYVEYRVKWHGISGLTLSVDKIITSDDRGRKIVTDSLVKVSVRNNAITHQNKPNMLGWYGMEEPKFIDNYEPYRIVDSIVRAATGNTQFLHTSITPGELGKYWYGNDGSWKYSPIIEFAKRAKPHIMHLNLYHYHNPNGLNQPGYLINNINWAILNLDSMALLNRRYGLDFGYAVYGGDSWSYDTLGNQTHVLYRPTTEQLLYTTNLGLLYGARQIWIDPAFSYDVDYDKDKPGTRGLLDIELNTTTTYNTFKDTIIPRLHGEFGRTLRKLRADSQHMIGLSLADHLLEGTDFMIRWNYIMDQSDTMNIGIFTDPERPYAKYIFTLYRFTETVLDPGMVWVTVNNMDATYNNYRVRELVTGTTVVCNRTVNNTVSFNISTPIGDGRLYEIMPMQLVTGNKTYLFNETFTDDVTIPLNDTITVGPGATLTFGNSSSLQNNGVVRLQGTAQQPVTLNFIQPANNNGLYNYNRLIVSDLNISNAAKGISNDATFIVNAGATLTFNGNSSLYNYGTLNIQGTAQQPVTLDFAQHYSNNGVFNYGTLQATYAHVKWGAFGIVNNNNAILNLQSSQFYYNNLGLVLNPNNQARYPITINNCDFTDNIVAVTTSQVLGTLTNSRIYENDYGLAINNSSVLNFGGSGIAGNNCIVDNYGVGIRVNASMPILGIAGQPWSCGENGIVGNGDREAIFENYSYSFAENNYWGPSQVTIDGSSYASLLPELQTNPCENRGNQLTVRGDESELKSKQNGLEGGTDDIIKQAYSLIQGPRFREGILLCKQVIDNSPDTSIAAPALMLLSLAEQKHQLNELKPYLQLLSASTIENRVRFVADMLLANDSNGNTRSRIELLLEKYVDTDIREEIHFSIFREYLFAERDTTGARGILRMMKERYNGQLTILAGIMMDGKKTPGGISKPMNTEDGTTIPVEYLLKGNYPNPFNPETVIEYGIPEAAEVTLEVYDIMGRLMNRETKNLQAGYHFYTWNGKEAASGVYLYRIIMKSQKDRKVRTFSSKMMLLR